MSFWSCIIGSEIALFLFPNPHLPPTKTLFRMKDKGRSLLLWIFQGGFSNKDKPILKEDNRRCYLSYICNKNYKVHFSNEIELVQHLQCSYTNYSAWKMTNKHWDLSSLWWHPLFLPNSSVFQFFHVLRAERSGLKPQGSYLVGSWFPWIPWIVMEFFWYLLVATWKRPLFHFLNSKFDKICGLLKLRKIRNTLPFQNVEFESFLQLSLLIILVLFRMNSVKALSFDRNKFSSNVIYCLYWILCWC